VPPRTRAKRGSMLTRLNTDAAKRSDLEDRLMEARWLRLYLSRTRRAGVGCRS
jgi:hypothetical protein